MIFSKSLLNWLFRDFWHEFDVEINTTIKQKMSDSDSDSDIGRDSYPTHIRFNNKNNLALFQTFLFLYLI